MKIAIVTAFYSPRMGYTENCLSKFLALRGNEVHVIATNWNVYGTDPCYEATYSKFLGPADCGVMTFKEYNYTVHRLPSRLIAGYVSTRGLLQKIRELKPDIVHTMEIASLQTFALAAFSLVSKFYLFSETHQHMSVVKGYMKAPRGDLVRKLAYRATRTLPTSIASRPVNRCYAIAPDCAEVAEKFYGVPKEKIKVQTLGTDTELFRPAVTAVDVDLRKQLRRRMGWADEDIICVYTGRFTRAKNPLALAQAISMLIAEGLPFRGLFIGDGDQKSEIVSYGGMVALPFMRYHELAEYYRAVDLAVWPAQESMSMLDAASSGLPLIVSDRMGDVDRIVGNGLTYRESDVVDLACTLRKLHNRNTREILGAHGREKMLDHYNWSRKAADIERDYLTVLSGGVLVVQKNSGHG